MPELTMSVRLAARPADVFAFHMDPQNLLKVTPPGVDLRIVEAPDRLALGAEVTLRTRVGPLRFHWTSRIVEFTSDERFADEQIAGPFRRWRHEHIFQPREGGMCLTDVVRYEVRFGMLAPLAATGVLHRHLLAMFRYRQAQMTKVFGAIGDPRARDGRV